MAPNRPVTFAFNGGPGASSVYLNFGAIGPKHVRAGNEGDSPSDPATLMDNPGTWLDFTDLVFIDPIGTGFSRSLVPEADAKKLFYSTVPDIDYLSRVVYDWLVTNDRLGSRKYLVGESYGGFRGPRITHYLQSQLGVAMNGVVLVSPYLNPTIEDNGDVSPIPWMVTLPSITAAHLERENKLTPQAMADVIAYTEGEYATDLIHGRTDPEATPRIIKKVTEMTGLDPEFVKRSGGRLETGAYLREVHRDEGKIGSVYDSNVTSFDPFPYSPDQRLNDPLLETIIAPDDHGNGGLRYPHRGLEGRRSLQRALLRCEPSVGPRRRAAQGIGRRPATGRRRRPQAARAHRPRLERSVLPVYGLAPYRRSDAGDGRSDAGCGQGISRWAHVLHAAYQPG